MVLNYLGYMLADKGSRLTEALKMIRKAVEIEPMNGAYLDSLGWAYFKLGQYELAETNLRQAVERSQTDPTVHDHLGDLYEKTGRIRLAAAQWEISVTQFSKSAPPTSNLPKLRKFRRNSIPLASALPSRTTSPARTNRNSQYSIDITSRAASDWPPLMYVRLGLRNSGARYATCAKWAVSLVGNFSAGGGIAL